MKKTLRGVLICTVALGVLGLCTESFAEVSSRGKGRSGSQRVAQVIPGDDADVNPWSERAGRRDRWRPGNVLNPRGGESGDLWPAVAESPLDPHGSWVVWSRGNGSRYDLAWSRWTPLGWQRTQWIFEDRPEPGHDLDADIQLDAEGLPFIVWWRNEAGVGRVYLSMYLQDSWMEPFAISQRDTDSRHPSVHVAGAGIIEVEYETRAGLVSQLVRFERPVTITDDINPQNHFRPEGAPVLVRRNPIP